MHTEDYVAAWIRRIKGEVEVFWRTTFNYIIIVDLDNYSSFLHHLLCVDEVQISTLKRVVLNCKMKEKVLGIL